MKKKFPGVDIDKIYKPRTCKCGNTYQRYTTLQNCCTKCLVAKGKKIVEKETRKVFRERKEKLKTKQQWLSEVQDEVNAYCRERDVSNGDGCISCGTHTGKKNGGHYRSVGEYPELRFHEDNINLQCERCNTFLSGNEVEYRKGLVKKIGEERVLALEGPHELNHYTIEELKIIRNHYRIEKRALKWKTLYTNQDFVIADADEK